MWRVLDLNFWTVELLKLTATVCKLLTTALSYHMQKARIFWQCLIWFVSVLAIQLYGKFSTRKNINSITSIESKFLPPMLATLIPPVKGQNCWLSMDHDWLAQCVEWWAVDRARIPPLESEKVLSLCSRLSHYWTTWRSTSTYDTAC